VPYATGRHQESLYVYDAGEAIMIYPDRQGGPPLPSLRLKLLQKGLDDFSYLAILQQRLEKRARRQHAADPAASAQRQVRDLAGKLVLDIAKYNQDTVTMQRLRGEVARRIAQLPE
jgi:hypothetical protein